MTSDTYNGWTNRETATAYKWLSEESFLRCKVLNKISDLNDLRHNQETGLVSVGVAVSDDRWQRFVADHIQDFVTDILDPTKPQNAMSIAMQADIGSLWRVNWREVAEHMMEGE